MIGHKAYLLPACLLVLWEREVWSSWQWPAYVFFSSQCKLLAVFHRGFLEVSSMSSVGSTARLSQCLETCLPAWPPAEAYVRGDCGPRKQAHVWCLGRFDLCVKGSFKEKECEIPWMKWLAWFIILGGSESGMELNYIVWELYLGWLSTRQEPHMLWPRGWHC